MSAPSGITCSRCGRVAPITDDELAGGGEGLPTLLPIPDGWMSSPEITVEHDGEYDSVHQPQFDPDRIMCQEHATPTELAAWLAGGMAVTRAGERAFEAETGRAVDSFDFDAPVDDSGEPR